MDRLFSHLNIYGVSLLRLCQETAHTIHWSPSVRDTVQERVGAETLYRNPSLGSAGHDESAV